MSNFWQRLFTGAVFTGALVAAVILSGWYLYIVFGLLLLLTLQEFAQLFKKSVYSPDPLVGPVIGFFIYIFYIIAFTSEGQLTPWLYFLSSCILLFPVLAIFELFRKKKTPFQNIGISLLGILYILVPFILLVAMSREANNETVPKLENQTWPVLAIFLIVWSNDTFAYLVGRKWGKTKLFERISPKKSWEGFFGGLVFALICGNLIAYFQDGAYLEYSVYALIISIFGTVGDLIESMLKRSLGVKDSGTILPGHGGLLDRLDAVLFAIPFIFICNKFLF